MNRRQQSDETRIAVGLEQTLALAALDERVARAVVEQDFSRLSELDVRLSPVEEQILRACRPERNERVIEQIRARLPRGTRRDFLSGVAAKAAVLAAAVASIRCDDACDGAICKGSRPFRGPQQKADVDAGAKGRDYRKSSARPLTKKVDAATQRKGDHPKDGPRPKTGASNALDRLFE